VSRDVDGRLVSLRAVAKLHQTGGLRRLHKLLNADSQAA
jgi:hypothetical protein